MTFPLSLNLSCNGFCTELIVLYVFMIPECLHGTYNIRLDNQTLGRSSTLALGAKLRGGLNSLVLCSGKNPYGLKLCRVFCINPIHYYLSTNNWLLKGASECARADRVRSVRSMCMATRCDQCAPCAWPRSESLQVTFFYFLQFAMDSHHYSAHISNAFAFSFPHNISGWIYFSFLKFSWNGLALYIQLFCNAFTNAYQMESPYQDIVPVFWQHEYNVPFPVSTNSPTRSVSTSISALWMQKQPGTSIVQAEERWRS
jgi:hypothetical protein